MIVKTGTALLWQAATFCGPVMVKGWTETGLVELYHMQRDEFFRVSADEFGLCRTLLFKDENLQVINPQQWSIQSAIWARAYLRCGASPQ
ncbi:hypothetical protein V0M98_37400 (plasmid) [Pseudomonas silesiensis]|uniref:hypothetical protein n=1 Tax=Pseudomonas silesiensis TaxID=1853130 RepID=UPI0030D3FB9C